MSDLLNALNWRYATKSFDSSKSIPAEDINKILEAARLSASSYGMQPYRVVFIQNEDLKKKMLPISYNQQQVVEAPFSLLFCAKKQFSEQDVDDMLHWMAEGRSLTVDSFLPYKQRIMQKINTMTPERNFEWAARQCYIALGNVMTVIASMGYDSCPMEGIDAKAFDELFELEKLGLKSIFLLPVGYRNQNDSYIQKAKIRVPFNDFIIKR